MTEETERERKGERERERRMLILSLQVHDRLTLNGEAESAATVSKGMF